MSIKVGKSFKALIAAGAALVMAASMAACGPSAGTPSEAKSSDTVSYTHLTLPTILRV